jgi:hypothetical protein
MGRGRRNTVIFTMVALTTFLVAPPAAFAAAPANDDFDTATEIAALPFVDTVDTTNATRADDDPWWCLVSESTVWYVFSATDSIHLEVRTDGSDYWPEISVWTGDRGALSNVACDGETVRFEAHAGQTYYLMIGDADWGGGGTLQLSVTEYEPPARPANDDFDDATVIPGLPFLDELDMSAATRAADDPYCGWWWEDATVWYVFTAAEDLHVDVDTAGSDFIPVVSVWTGQRGELANVACGEDAVLFDARAGETYYLRIGDPGWWGQGRNLSLSVSAYEPPPPFTAAVTVDPTGTVDNRTGQVTIRGTISCSMPSWYWFDVSLHQRLGRFQATGHRWVDDQCEPNGSRSWAVTMSSDSGVMFGMGQATVRVSGAAWYWDRFGEYDARLDEVATIRLTKG